MFLYQYKKMTLTPIIRIIDGDAEFMVSNAQQVADYLDQKHGIGISKWQATRLCNAHPYKRPKFALPPGLSAERLNTTIACTRNRAAAQLPSMIDAFNAESEPVMVLHEAGP